MELQCVHTYVRRSGVTVCACVNTYAPTVTPDPVVIMWRMNWYLVCLGPNVPFSMRVIIILILWEWVITHNLEFCNINLCTVVGKILSDSGAFKNAVWWREFFICATTVGNFAVQNPYSTCVLYVLCTHINTQCFLRYIWDWIQQYLLYFQQWKRGI